MPELPEVETIIRELKKSPIVRDKIVNIKVRWPKTIKTHSVDDFKNELIGNRIIELSRRAKYLVFKISSGKTLILHLRMTGKLILHKKGKTIGTHDHVIFYFKNGYQLHYNDTRKFGRFYLTDRPQEILGKLGPEPLNAGFKLKNFRKALGKRTGQIKPLLLNQQFIAGLGNIYADEALWEAGIHPEQNADLISSAKQKKLYKAIRKVLKAGIKNKGTTLGPGPGNFARMNRERGNHRKLLKVYKKEGEACPRCGRRIKKIKVAQRSSHFCSNCQRQRHRSSGSTDK
jgi:formamidopyrimidine-DNA glycosylase